MRRITQRGHSTLFCVRPVELDAVPLPQRDPLTSPRFLADSHGLREPEGEEDMREFSGLVVEVPRAPGVEVADGWEELGRVHGSTPLCRGPLRAPQIRPCPLRPACGCAAAARPWPTGRVPTAPKRGRLTLLTLLTLNPGYSREG
jgi:hypothetical protein